MYKYLLGLLAGLVLFATSVFAAVDINTADQETLMTLEGVGESKAQAIIDYREKNGPFESVDGVTNVDGIGEGTLENIRDEITVGGDE